MRIACILLPSRRLLRRFPTSKIMTFSLINFRIKKDHHKDHHVALVKDHPNQSFEVDQAEVDQALTKSDQDPLSKLCMDNINDHHFATTVHRLNA